MHMHTSIIIHIFNFFLVNEGNRKSGSYNIPPKPTPTLTINYLSIIKGGPA